MKPNRLAALGLLIATTCASRTAMAVGENLIPNGSFDTDLSGWETTVLHATLGWSPDDADGASGSGSAQMETDVPELTWLRSACVPVVGGRDYVFSAARKRWPDGNAYYLTIVGAYLVWGQGAACDLDVEAVALYWSADEGWSTASQIVSAPVYATWAKVALWTSIHAIPALEAGDFAEQDAVFMANFDNVFLATACGGTCGDPVLDVGEHAAGDANAALVTSSDALYILKAAIGEQACELCTCDVDGSGEITATDALLTLSAATGVDVSLTCPQ